MSQCDVTTETFRCLDPFLLPVLSNIVNEYLHSWCELKIHTKYSYCEDGSVHNIVGRDTQTEPVSISFHYCNLENCSDQNTLILQFRSNKIKAYLCSPVRNHQEPREDGQYQAFIEFVTHGDDRNKYFLLVDKAFNMFAAPMFYFKLDMDLRFNNDTKEKTFVAKWFQKG
jgi:hypothetical protein